ncbi:MAG: hypothetical protein ETSY2_19485 [Candidatus Entotheonella gemina]|uniref:FAD-binding PCMH-type domain-containing protein n=1 Tax=Candidatus Entotheonella gemina TaxID=1429439 RepID=W4M8S0_9BACT|nr:MAG: hypothetical protein ETSY2_19485 [Candidatus Entotheonella gemina]
MAVWENYGENQRVNARAIHVPGSLAEVREIVTAAARDGLGVKAYGSGHSFSGVARCDTNEILIDLSPENEQLKHRCVIDGRLINPAAAGKPLVAVETAVAVYELSDWLNAQEHPLALPAIGAVNGQTIVGAMATGTHGSEIAFGPMANMARAFFIVDGRGDCLLVQPSTPVFKDRDALQTALTTLSGEAVWLQTALETARPVADDDLFRACLIGVGVVGMIYAVVLEVQPQFRLQETRTARTWEDVKAHWQMPAAWHEAKAAWEQARDHSAGEALRQARRTWQEAQHQTLLLMLKRYFPDGDAEGLYTFSFLVNPYPNRAEGTHSCFVTVSTLAEPASVDSPREPALDRLRAIDQACTTQSWFLRLRRSLFRGAQRIFNRLFRRLGLDEVLTDILVWFLRTVPSTIDDLIDAVLRADLGQRLGLSHDILTREVYEVKGWGIEVGVSLDRLVDAVDTMLAQAAEMRRRRRYLTGPIALRFVAMTEAMLGMSADEMTVQVEITILKDTPHAERTLPRLERILLDRYDGVFHWGLEWDVASVEDARRSYRHFETFRRIVGEHLDPDSRFANTYTRRVGIYTTGSEAGSAAI